MNSDNLRPWSVICICIESSIVRGLSSVFVSSCPWSVVCTFLRKFERMTTFVKRLTKEQALPKIKHYCTYQERSHKEVKEKLYSLGLYKTDVEELLSQLIEEDYLNEERFAIQYAGGKFRMKQWGRVKIQMGLKERQVSVYCIRKAMGEISPADYEKTLQRLAEKKWELLKGEQYLSREGKTRNYLLQKGYESSLVQMIVAGLKANGQ